MDCLTDFIGIRGCESPSPPAPSGLYINNLPGVELKNIDEIANSEQSTYLGVWAEVQERALRRFETDVIAEFGKRYRLRQITQTADLGKKVDAASLTAPAAEWRGITIETSLPDQQFVGSNMQKLHVDNVKVYLSGPANFDIKVFDIDLGVVLDTITVTGALGWNTTVVNTSYDARRIFIGYDATAVNSVELDLSKINLGTWLGDCGCGCFGGDSWWSLWYGWGCDCKSFIRGARTSDLSTNVTDPEVGTNSFGLSAVFSVKCTYDNIVCLNRQHFAQALLYCLGSELMTERIYSSRINRWTTVDKPKAQELRKYYEARYKGGVFDEVTYEGELYTAIYGISLNQGDCCLECDGPFKFVETIP